MIINNADQIDYFTKSVLFFVQSPNPDYNYVMISYITGAILPVVALCMTSMIVKIMGNGQKQIVENDERNLSEEIPAEVGNTVTEPQEPVEKEVVKPIRTPRQRKLFD